MTFAFSGRRVLVTGASRGIGRAVAQAFADGGAQVAVHYNRGETAARETVASLAGGPHPLIAANLGQPGEGRRLVQEAARLLGGLNGVVNNAGIYQSHAPGKATAEEWDQAWRRTLQVNLSAAAEICHQAIPFLRDAGGGHIINITSRGAFRGEPDAPAYGASKAGLNALSQSLAKALAPEGIYVFAVAPGWVETEMAAPHLEGEGGNEIRGQIPLGRVATPEEIAKAVTFFASAGTESMTGAILDVNGASYLRT